MPDAVTFEEAAALPVAYGTAHRMLITHKTIQQGDRVMILGASGGGARAASASAKCSGRGHRLRQQCSQAPTAQELGADHVLNFQEVDFSQWVIDTWQAAAALVQGVSM